MKEVILATDTLITGSAVADALLDYAEVVIRNATSVSVTIPILAGNGTTEQRTILLGPATQIETRDVDGVTENELDRFPVPAFTPVGGRGAPANLEPLPGLPDHLDSGHRPHY